MRHDSSLGFNGTKDNWIKAALSKGTDPIYSHGLPPTVYYTEVIIVTSHVVIPVSIAILHCNINTPVIPLFVKQIYALLKDPKSKSER